MKCNVGKADRIIRIILGLILLGWGLYASSLWGVVGLVLFVTGVFSWCPIYFPFHISTDKDAPRHPGPSQE